MPPKDSLSPPIQQPAAAGTIPHVRTYAEDLRRAQATAATAALTSDQSSPAVPVIPLQAQSQEKTRVEKLQEELTRHAEPLKETHVGVNVEPIGQTPLVQSETFDIREAAREAVGEGTIIQDRRVTDTRIGDLFLSGMRSWWMTSVVPFFAQNDSAIQMDIAPRVQTPVWDSTHAQPVAAVRTLAHDTQLVEEGKQSALPRIPPASWKRVSEPRTEGPIPSATPEEMERYRAALRTLPKPPAPKETRMPFKQPRPTRSVAVSANAELISKSSTQAVAPEQEARERLARLGGVTPQEKPVSRDIPFIPPTPAREHMTAPIRTYRYDALSDIKTRELSARDIATHEAVRREQGGQSLKRERATPPTTGSHLFSRIAIGLALTCIVCALIGGGYLYIISRTTSPTEEVVRGVPSFFAASYQTPLPLTPDRISLLTTLNNARSQTSAEPGATTHLYLVTGSTPTTPVPTHEMLTVLDPRAPGALLRSLTDTHMFGSYGETRTPFLILRTTSLETALAGMRAWEEYMSVDLAPYFGAPVRRSYDPSALTVDQTRDAFFGDTVLRNHEVRYLLDEYGTERIVYAFVRDLIVITQDRTTLEALMSELE